MLRGFLSGLTDFQERIMKKFNFLAGAEIGSRVKIASQPLDVTGQNSKGKHGERIQIFQSFDIDNR